MQTEIKAKDVGIESALLKSLAIRSNFDNYHHLIDYKRVLPYTELLLRDYKKYYEMYSEHREINWGLFHTQFATNWHAKDDIFEVTYFKDYILPEINKCEDFETESCILGLMQKAVKETLQGMQQFDLEKMRQILDEYEEKTASITGTGEATDIDCDNVDLDILDRTDGIPHFLPSINAGLGPIGLGDFMVIPADTNTGKTAWGICQAIEAIKWRKNRKDAGRVLIITSEDTESDYMARLWSCLYKDKYTDGYPEICEKREEVRELFSKEYTKNSLTIVHVSNAANIGSIMARIRRYKPCLLIVDILDAIAENEDAGTLKRLYDNIRRVATKYTPVISMTQSGVTEYFDAEAGEMKAKKWLTMKDLYGSKTGKGGAATIVIGIGKDMQQKSLRYINIAKKKRGKAVQVECKFTEEYSLYEELPW